MSSLRLALKLSLQENPDAATTNEKQAEPFEALDAIGNLWCGLIWLLWF